MAWPRLGSPFARVDSGRIDVTYDAEARLVHALLSFLTHRNGRVHAGAGDATSKAADYLADLAQAYGTLSPRALMQTLPPVAALVVDPTVLGALAHGSERARVALVRAVEMSARILVPATALLDVRYGGIAEAVGTLVPIDAEIARTAGALSARARLTMPLDALTVAIAAREASAALLTTDRAGVAALARAADRPALHVLALH